MWERLEHVAVVGSMQNTTKSDQHPEDCTNTRSAHTWCAVSQLSVLPSAEFESFFHCKHFRSSSTDQMDSILWDKYQSSLL